MNSLTSASGQRTCDHAITEFVAWYRSEPRLAFNRTVVLRYRIHLEQRHYAPATINLRLAAVRRVAYEAAAAGLLHACRERRTPRGRWTPHQRWISPCRGVFWAGESGTSPPPPAGNVIPCQVWYAAPALPGPEWLEAHSGYRSSLVATCSPPPGGRPEVWRNPLTALSAELE